MFSFLEFWSGPFLGPMACPSKGDTSLDDMVIQFGLTLANLVFPLEGHSVKKGKWAAWATLAQPCAFLELSSRPTEALQVYGVKTFSERENAF